MAGENATIALIAGALITYWLISPNNTIEDKNVYYRYCLEDFKHNAFSCPGRIGVIKTEYKIFIERQMVVSKGGFINSYKSCSVFDKNNWECDTGEGQWIHMRDGDIYASNDGSIDEKGEKSMIPRYDQIGALNYYIRSVIESSNLGN